MSKELNFKQELTAAFGQPIAENPTQVMVEAAYRHHNLDWRYLTIEVGPDDLEDAVKGAKVMGFQGFNCTIPHKVKVIDYLDGLGESASLMGRLIAWCAKTANGSEKTRTEKGSCPRSRNSPTPRIKAWSYSERVEQPGRLAWKWHWRGHPPSRS